MPNRQLTLEKALLCAVQTAIEQPREVPAAPDGWVERAQAALASLDQEQITECANVIAIAHNQYRAEFDVKGWLYDLRNVRFELRFGQ